MRVLFLSQRIPYPPDRGDRIRSYHLVKRLARCHQVVVASLAQSPEEVVRAQPLKSLVEHLESEVLPGSPLLRYPSAVMSGRPLTMAHYWSARLHAKVRSLLPRCQAVFVFCTSMAPYVRDCAHPRLIDFVDCDSAKWDDYAERAPAWKGLVYRREARLLRAYESQIAREYSQAFVTTQAERALLSGHADTGRVMVLRQGIDLDYYRPGWALGPDGGNAVSESDVAEGYPSRTDAPMLVFTGVMDYPANIDGVVFFCREVLPLIRQEIPETKFRIVGRDPTASVRALASDPSVEVTGAVEDVRPYLAQATVSVVPLRIACGVQNKILEAMASGVPVVSTRGAAKGLDGGDPPLRVADSPTLFAGEVVRLLRDPDERRRLATAARSWVEREYDWERTLLPLEEAIDRLS